MFYISPEIKWLVRCDIYVLIVGMIAHAWCRQWGWLVVISVAGMLMLSSCVCLLDRLTKQTPKCRQGLARSLYMCRLDLLRSFLTRWPWLSCDTLLCSHPVPVTCCLDRADVAIVRRGDAKYCRLRFARAQWCQVAKCAPISAVWHKYASGDWLPPS